jgi:hypothetical protein
MQNLNSIVESLSMSSRVAIVLCANAFKQGGNWGLLRQSNREFNNTFSILSEANQDIRLTRVYNGLIVECRDNFLADTINAIQPHAIDEDFGLMVARRKEEERHKLTKLLQSVVDDECKYERKTTYFGELIIGLYSMNITNFIRINGIDIPAYKLSLAEALPCLKLLEENGLPVFVCIGDGEGDRTFKALSQLMAERDIASMLQGLDISDTDTGVFFTIRYPR